MAIEDLLHPLLASYIKSPQWVKHSVGRAYSWLPVSLRRGKHYQHFAVEAALSNETDIAQLSARKLAATLQWALRTVPAYRQYQHLLKQRDTPLEILRELPLISKDDIKHDVVRFMSTGISSRAGMKTFTGGSTTTPMMFYLHKGISRTKEYGFMENFHQRVAFTNSDVVLALRGRIVPTSASSNGKLWMYEPIKKQLIVSSHHLERTNMANYVEAIRTWQPTYIQAYPSAIYPLTRWLCENPAPDVTRRIKGIMLFSENIVGYQIALLEETFACPILKHYGQSERVLMAASMPDDGRYFFWPQYGHFELVDGAGKPITRSGILGEIVGTAFDNLVMPFVRYRTGDMAVLSEKQHPLLPGFPAVERIEGRRQEFIVCHDRRLISINAMSIGLERFGNLARVDAMQYEQTKPGHFSIKVVTAHPLSLEVCQHVTQTIRNNTQGGCSAEVIQVSDIVRTARGKHPMLVQHLDIGQYQR